MREVAFIGLCQLMLHDESALKSPQAPCKKRALITVGSSMVLSAASRTETFSRTQIGVFVNRCGTNVAPHHWWKI